MTMTNGTTPLIVLRDGAAGDVPAFPYTDMAVVLGQYLKLRRRREQIFGPHLFSDPAWDMLLDLYIARQASRDVSVSSACLASGAPLTTALRWLRRLEHEGYVERDADQRDARRIHVRLTDHAVAQLHGLMAFAAGLMD